MTDTKKPRGFAAISPEQHRAICAKGGVAAHAQGKAHQFNTEEASAAGKKGGAAVALDRAHMAEIGRKGGRSRGAKSKAKVVPSALAGAVLTPAQHAHIGAGGGDEAEEAGAEE